jgi:cytochrome c oxidase cbb3-type subunit III
VKPTRDQLLNHEADGIREFDNALPRWWLYGFYVTIAFSIVYVANYHLLPQPLYGEKGMVAEYTAEIDAAARAGGGAGPAAALASVPVLRDADSLDKGKAIFEGQTNLCVSCHRADLGGLVGPNLTDDLWLHGCDAASIVKSITTGFPARGMLPYGSGARLDQTQLAQVASYVLSRRGSNPASPKAPDPARDKTCR